jgi:hypothetical protein
MAKEMSKTEKMRKLFANKALDVEEMDNVAGGSIHEIADDSRFLNVLLRGHPAQPDRHGERKLELDYANNGSRYAELRTAWEACGVHLHKIDETGGNRYVLHSGREVTREQAMNHAMNVIGKQLKKSDWYWD